MSGHLCWHFLSYRSSSLHLLLLLQELHGLQDGTVVMDSMFPQDPLIVFGVVTSKQLYNVDLFFFLGTLLLGRSPENRKYTIRFFSAADISQMFALLFPLGFDKRVIAQKRISHCHHILMPYFLSLVLKSPTSPMSSFLVTSISAPLSISPCLLVATHL